MAKPLCRHDPIFYADFMLFLDKLDNFENGIKKNLSQMIRICLVWREIAKKIFVDDALIKILTLNKILVQLYFVDHLELCRPWRKFQFVIS